METLKYKDYIGSLHYSKEDKVFWGRLELIDSLVTFEAQNASELEGAFKDAVDDYLETCKSKNISPHKPFKGVFNIRIKPELHKAAYQKAIEDGVSLNRFIEDSIQKNLSEVS